MDSGTSCKDKLVYFRIKELKDVLGQLGLPKQGKKQDLMDRILSVLSDEQVATHDLAKKVSFGRDRIEKIVDDTYRKMQITGANDLASKNHCISDVKSANPPEEREDSSHLDMKVRCLCGGTLITESMIQCEDSRCQVWQHIGCVLIPEKPMDAIIPEIPSSFYCELCRLNRADPFWLTVAHPLLPAKLNSPGTAPDGSNPLQSVDRTYPLSRADRELLQRSDYDLQVWCILLNDKVQFRMQWPQYPELLVNGVQIRTINRTQSQLLGTNGRDDGPIVTLCSREGSNKICLSFSDARVFCFGVRIARRRTVQQVLSLVPKEVSGESFEDALARVRRCIGGGAVAKNADSDSDLEVVADTVPINLRCPMSGSRMKTAGRFKPCIHMGCFDLETFVELTQRSRKWQCPHCLKNYSLENMIIDPYFNRITSLMQNCGEDVSEIVVKPDGSWRAKISGDIKDLLQWHLPDGTLCSVPDLEVKSHVDVCPQIKKEIISEGYTGLKLGIRKNNNGDWVFSKPGVTEYHQSSGTLALDRSADFCQNLIPTSSSATGSCRDGEDPSVNQDGGGSGFDLQFNSHELDSISLDLYRVGDVCPSEPVENDHNIIILSDSDEDNVTMISPPIFSESNVVPPDLTSTYPNESGLRAETVSYLGFCDNNTNDFGMPLWPLHTCPQNGPGLKLFGSDDVPDAFAGLGSDDYSLQPNGYGEACQAAARGDLPPCPENSSNACLMNSSTPLTTYNCGDQSLQIFLPSQPVASAPSQTDLSGRDEMDNNIGPDDWMSLSLGGTVVEPHTNSASEQRFTPDENRMESLATASLLLSMSGERPNKSSLNGERSSISFCHPRQPRSVRKRPFQSINLDSDSD